MAQIDLLRNPINLVYAVNCQIEDTTLRCGALFLEPMIPTSNIRLQSEETQIEIELPEELLNRQESTRAWNIELDIVGAEE